MVNLVYTKNDASGIAGVISFAGDTPQIEFDTTGEVCVCDLVMVENGVRTVLQSMIPGFDVATADKKQAVEMVKLVVSIYDVEDEEDEEYDWKSHMDDFAFSVWDVEQVSKETGLPYTFDTFTDDMQHVNKGHG